MAAIWAKKIKIKAKAAFTTFSLFTTLTITIPNFQPRVVNSQINTFVNYPNLHESKLLKAFSS
jgi:hypothetical protein